MIENERFPFEKGEIAGEKIIIHDKLFERVKYIKEVFKFDILKDITAVDLKEKGIELNYRLYSTSDNEEAIVTICVKDEIESITSLFDSATADEKEIYDLFGIKFIGNKELKRLYMPESWEGHPLKKDYQESDERLNWND